MQLVFALVAQALSCPEAEGCLCGFRRAYVERRDNFCRGAPSRLSGFGFVSGTADLQISVVRYRSSPFVV